MAELAVRTLATRHQNEPCLLQIRDQLAKLSWHTRDPGTPAPALPVATSDQRPPRFAWSLSNRYLSPSVKLGKSVDPPAHLQPPFHPSDSPRPGGIGLCCRPSHLKVTEVAVGPVDALHGTIRQAVDAFPGAVRQSSCLLLPEQDQARLRQSDLPLVRVKLEEIERDSVHPAILIEDIPEQGLQLLNAVKTSSPPWSA